MVLDPEPSPPLVAMGEKKKPASGPRRVPKVADAQHLKAIAALQHLQDFAHTSTSCEVFLSLARSRPWSNEGGCGASQQMKGIPSQHEVTSDFPTQYSIWKLGEPKHALGSGPSHLKAASGRLPMELLSRYVPSWKPGDT